MTGSPACPSCGRPVAVARPRCLYCGAALGADAVAAAAEARAAVEAAPPLAGTGGAGTGPPSTGGGPASAGDRVLVVVDLAAPPEVVARALGLPLYDARQRTARGGFALHRVAAAEEAGQEAARLRAGGLAAFELPDAEVRPRLRPLVARRGGPAGGALRLGTDDGTVEIPADSVALVVRGPIAREYPPTADVRRVRVATLDPGYRFHLHRRGHRQPVELDPAGFEFGGATGAASSLLQMAAWVDGLFAGAVQDDAFRYAAPALAPAAPGDAESGPAAAARALARRPDAVPVLDNLEQFRAYSAWRGALEARRAG